MSLVLPVLCLLLRGENNPVKFQFLEVFPKAAASEVRRSDGQERAVVLIHGFAIHFRTESVLKAEFRRWQQPETPLVQELGKTGDVYSYCYSQNAPLDNVVSNGGLREAVAQLRKAGYRDIVLVGHSAGGLIARQFVEDYPGDGVTKVLQVCSPNTGTPSAKTTVLAAQQPFLNCLTEDGRRECLKSRAGRKIPDSVEFICVIGRPEPKADSDGVVPCVSQWSEDLQKQCIPVVVIAADHLEATRVPANARIIAGLVKEKQQRWLATKVEQTRKELFGK